jgi:hypothetical protein
VLQEQLLLAQESPEWKRPEQGRQGLWALPQQETR